ncbi:MAG: hypothetical protein AAF531_26610 [Actinomycetota bacterium]
MGERRRYEHHLLADHPAFAIEPLSPALQAKVDAANWPDGLLDRVLALRRDRDELEAWLDNGFPTAEMLDQWADMKAETIGTSLTGRLGTWEDGPVIADLCDNAPETVGDWTVTVERSPNPYAQYRLQENAYVVLVEDHRVGLAMSGHSIRNTYIDGQKTTANYLSGWRVRDGFRGLGLSTILQNTAGSGLSPFGLVSYWFVRDGNAATSWIDRIRDDMADKPEGFARDTDRLSATVSYFGQPELGRRSPRVRPATEDDLDHCIGLINRTNDGLDLFRPYTADYLDRRMSDPAWGPKPVFYPTVYGLAEYRVLEVDGTIVACAGLWDRGRDVREVWVGPDGDDGFTVDPTAVMDLGVAEGHEAAMAELLSHLLAESATLNRSGMLAALEWLPEVAEAAAHLDPRSEIRALHVQPFALPDLTVDLVVTRPFVDLAYW